MAIVVSHNEIISKERIIVTYHPIGKKKNIYSLFCLKKSGGYSTKPKFSFVTQLSYEVIDSFRLGHGQFSIL